MFKTGPVTQQERRDGMERCGMQVLHCKIIERTFAVLHDAKACLL
jgi:hypothetical protein